jgi:hypothetical protein
MLYFRILLFCFWGVQLQAQATTLRYLPQDLPLLLRFKPQALQARLGLDSSDLRQILLPRLVQAQALAPQASLNQLRQGVDLGLDWEQTFYTGLILDRDQFEFWVLPLKELSKFNDFVFRHISQRITLRQGFFLLLTDQYMIAWRKGVALIVLPKWAYGTNYKNAYADQYAQLERQFKRMVEAPAEASLAQDPRFVALNSDFSMHFNQGAWWKASQQRFLKDTTYQGAARTQALALAQWFQGWQYRYEIEALSAPILQCTGEQQLPPALVPLLGTPIQATALPKAWWNLADQQDLAALALQFEPKAWLRFAAEQLNPLLPEGNGFKPELLAPYLSGQSLFMLRGLKEDSLGARKVLMPQFLWILGTRDSAKVLKTLVHVGLSEGLEDLGKGRYRYRSAKMPWPIYWVWEEGQLKISNDLKILNQKRANKRINKALEEQLDQSPQSFWVNWAGIQALRKRWPEAERLQRDQLWEFLAKDLQLLSWRSPAAKPLEQRLRLTFKSAKNNPLKITTLDYLGYLFPLKP